MSEHVKNSHYFLRSTVLLPSALRIRLYGLSQFSIISAIMNQFDIRQDSLDGDQPDARPLSTQNTTHRKTKTSGIQTHNSSIQAAKTHAEPAATVTGINRSYKFQTRRLRIKSIKALPTSKEFQQKCSFMFV
jgi:hypothetical protein